MPIWTIKYTAIPTNYNRPQVAKIEADTAEDATALLMDRLGENYDAEKPGGNYVPGTYVKNYVLCEPQPYTAPVAKGRILSLTTEENR